MSKEWRSQSDTSSDLLLKLSGDWQESLGGSYRYHQSLAEFRAWTFDFIASYAKTGDSNTFIKQWSIWQAMMTDFVRESPDKHVFVTEKQMVASFGHFQLHCPELNLRTSEAFAHHTWLHERAHQQAYTKWGIDSAIGLALPEYGGEMFAQPYVGVDLRAFRHLERNGTLMQAVGEALLAPQLAGVGYKEETDAARLLLTAAAKSSS